MFGKDVLELGAMDTEDAKEAVKKQLCTVYGSEVVESALKSIEVKLWRENDPFSLAPLPSPRRSVEFGHSLLRKPAKWGGSGVALVFSGTESEAENGHIEGALRAGERAAAVVAGTCAGI